MGYLDDNGIDLPGNVGDFPAPPQGNLGPAPGDYSAIEQQLRQAGGAMYDPTDLEGYIRNTTYNEPGKAVSPEAALQNQLAIYQQRAASNGGGGQPAPQEGGYSFGGGAPQSIQPYQSFNFDPSSVGKSDAFKFRFDKAMQAIERSGAAKGTLLNPQTLTALQNEASGMASQEYGDEYNRQANTYGLNRDNYQWGEEGRYNSQRNNRLDDYSFMNTDRNFNRGVLENDRDYNRGTYQDDRNFDYGKSRDTTNDYWKFVDYGYNAARNPR